MKKSVAASGCSKYDFPEYRRFDLRMESTLQLLNTQSSSFFRVRFIVDSIVRFWSFPDRSSMIEARNVRFQPEFSKDTIGSSACQQVTINERLSIEKVHHLKLSSAAPCVLSPVPSKAAAFIGGESETETRQSCANPNSDHHPEQRRTCRIAFFKDQSASLAGVNRNRINENSVWGKWEKYTKHPKTTEKCDQQLSREKLTIPVTTELLIWNK